MHGGAHIPGGGAYIRNGLSVSEYGGLILGELMFWVGMYSGGGFRYLIFIYQS